MQHKKYNFLYIIAHILNHRINFKYNYPANINCYFVQMIILRSV
jgi:hypothetical protein